MAEPGIGVAGRLQPLGCRCLRCDRPLERARTRCHRALYRVMSDSTEPSAHAAYTLSIVVMLCPCCFAIHNGLLPIIRFQLTEQ
jgi:hypothetical protein